MIQIIGLRPFIDKKTGKEKKRHHLYGTFGSIASLFENIDSVIETIPRGDRWNVYYTALDCKDPKSTGNKLRRFQSQRVIPFDIDGIDTKRLDDYTQVFFETTGADSGSTGVVFSGNGLQFIIELNEPFDDVGYFDNKRPHYKAICTKLDKAMSDAGLEGNADPSVWSAARILRLPNTENRKPGKKGTKQASLLQSKISPQEWSWEKVSQLPEIDKSAQVEWSPQRAPDLDEKAILTQCQFLASLRTSPEKVREPQFYAAMSIIGRFSNGLELAKKIADEIKQTGSDSTVAGYADAEIQEKMEQATVASGPRTCKSINDCWGECKTCPHFEKLISPISLKSKEHIATKSTGFYHWNKGKPTPAYIDLLKYFDQQHKHVSLEDNGLVYVFNGTHYEMWSKTKLANFAHENMDPKPKSGVTDEFVKLMMRTNIVKMDFFQKHISGYMNFHNGVLNQKTKMLAPHSDKIGFRYVLPYDYNGTAKAPRFDAFLNEITGDDKEARAVLEEFGGYALSGDSYWIHKALLLSGEGRNGKSKFIEALQLVAGDNNYSNVDLEALSNENSRQLLEGKLFNVVEEISHKAMKETKTIKAVTSGARQQVKLMWNQPYFAEMTAKQIFACNTLPKSNDSSYGYLSRMVIVPFNQLFVGEKADPFLLEKFEAELPGIFNIFLAGYDRLSKNRRFSSSQSVDDAIAAYAEDNNIVAVWMAETDSIEVKPLNGKEWFLSSEEAYASFNLWLMGHDSGSRFEAVTFIEFCRLLSRAIPEGMARLSRKRIDGIRKRGFFDAQLRRVGSRVKGEKGAKEVGNGTSGTGPGIGSGTEISH